MREDQGRRVPSWAALDFWIDPDRDAGQQADKPALMFDIGDIATAETLTALIITSRERRFIEWLVWRHDHFVASRECAFRTVQEALRCERERRDAEVRTA